MPTKTEAEIQAAFDAVDSKPGSQAQAESETKKIPVFPGYEHDGLHYRSKAKRWLNTNQGKNVERTAFGLSGVSLLTAFGLAITLLIPGMASGVLISAMCAMFGATVFFGGVGGTMNEQAAQAEREATQDKAQKELEAKQAAPALQTSPAPAVAKALEPTAAPAPQSQTTPGLKSILKKPTLEFDQLSSSSSSSSSSSWSASSSMTSSGSSLSDDGSDEFARERAPTSRHFNDPYFRRPVPVSGNSAHPYPQNLFY